MYCYLNDWNMREGSKYFEVTPGMCAFVWKYSLNLKEPLSEPRSDFRHFYVKV
jgi:hypothetical protein